MSIDARQKISISLGVAGSVFAFILSLVNGWVLFAVRAANDDLTKLRDTVSVSVVERAAASVKLDSIVLSVRDLTVEQKATSRDVTALTVGVSANHALTQKAVDRADAAFAEANTVNRKIELLGLQVRGGGTLNSRK